MSKKIQIKNSDVNRPNLVELFRNHLSNYRDYINSTKKPRNLGNGVIVEMDDEEYSDMCAYWSALFPSCLMGDYEGDYDDATTIYPTEDDDTDPYVQFWEREEDNKRKRKNANGKYKHRSRKSRARIIDMRKVENRYPEDDYDFDDIHLDCDEKVIYFYSDYHDKYGRDTFHSLKEFSDFCINSGYIVPRYVEDDIVYRVESHCCLNPKAEKGGILEIMSEHSYGEMFYEACEDWELSQC